MAPHEQARDYDRSVSTRRVCIGGLVLTWLAGIAGVVAIIALLATKLNESNGLVEMQLSGRIITLLLPLGFSVIVTLCNECVGLTHTTTLRWALWQEGRLKFNSNLRFLTSARRSPSNGWLVNILCILMTTISYTAAGGVAITRGYTEDNVISISLPAIALLSLGLLTQAAVATWALLAMKVDVLSWSSNPLNNAFICHQHGLHRLSGFTLVSYQRTGPAIVSQPLQPRTSQLSLGSSRPFARVVVGLQWIIAILAFMWAIVSQYLGQRERIGTSGLHHGQVLQVNLSVNGGPDILLSLTSLALSLGLQVAFTFTLHCTELIVNVNRDERTWRKTANLQGEGAYLASNAIRDACTSWMTIVLVIFKIGIHWAFVEAVKVGDGQIDGFCGMWAIPLFILASFSTLLAAFGTFLCFQQHRGPQPTTYGHYQTLIDLIDDFGLHGSLFWGDKGHLRWESNGVEVRVAGTAAGPAKLGPIQKDVLYQ